MVTQRVAVIAAVSIALLLLSFGWREAEATPVTLTSGTITGYTVLGTLDVAGPDFALTGTVSILDLVGVTDCVLCQPGQLFNCFWTFDRILTGTLTWQNVEHTLVNETVHGVMSGAGYLLPAALEPAFSVDLPFTLTITLGTFGLVANGPGLLPVTFSPLHDANAWGRTGHDYSVRVSVPGPSSGRLMLSGVLVLMALGWLLRRAGRAVV